MTLHQVYCDFCCIKFTSDREEADVCAQCEVELEKRLEQMRERCAKLCDDWAAAYPLDAFPKLPPPPEPVSRDQVAGSMGRHVASGLAKQIRALPLVDE